MKIFVDCDRFGATLWFDDGTMRHIKGYIGEIANIIKNLAVEQFKNNKTGESFQHQFMEIYIDCMGIGGHGLCDYLQEYGVEVNKITRNKLQLHDNMVIHECSDEDYNYFLKILKYESFASYGNMHNFEKEYRCKWIGKNNLK